ncbi:MAG: hypothetical protein ABJA82_11090, partial [Myxococcales bacterium]
MNRFARAVCSVAALVVLGAGGAARGENRVTVRGQYYREPSTRVVQPVAELAADLPGGVDMSTHYLLDAITSASVASGGSGDNLFTEYRNEVGVSLGKTWSRLRLGAAYRYSAESDYWSHTAALSAALRVWSDTGTVALSAGLGKDQVGRRVQNNTPDGAPPSGTGCVPTRLLTCPLDTVFAGVGYSQVLSPTLLVQGGYEVAVNNGYLASVYRGVPPWGNELVPDNRVRQALSARGAKFFSGTNTGFQLHYRYYWDLKWQGSDPLLVARSLARSEAGNPWQVRSHTVEVRVYQAVGRDLELRLTARFYSQGPANFWCDQAQVSGCYTDQPYRTADPKLQPVATVFV